PKTRKYKWLTSADLVAKGKQPKWKRAKRRVIQEVAANADESELAGDDNTELSGAHDNAPVPSRIIASTREEQNLPEKPALDSTEASLQEDPPRTSSSSSPSLALTVSNCPLPANPPASTKSSWESVEQTTSRKRR